MALSGKEKKELKARGQTLEARVHFGKEGLNANAIKDLSAILNKENLVKIKLPRHSETPKTEFAKQIAEACDAEFVACLGFSALIYKARPKIIANKISDF